MKVFNRVLLIIMASTVGLGVVLGVGGLAMGGSPTLSASWENGRLRLGSAENSGEVVNVKEDNLEPFKSIDIDINFGKVEFIESDTFGIDIKTTKGDRETTWDNSNGNLVIKTINNGHSFSSGINIGLFSWGDVNKDRVTVYLPKGHEMGNVTINSDSGLIKASHFKADTVSVKADFGEVDLGDISANRLDAQISSGVFICNDLNIANDFVFENQFGESRLTNVTGQSITANAASGKVRFDNCNIAKMGVESKFGSVIAEQLVTQDMNIDCESGDIEMSGDIGATFVRSDFGSVKIDTSYPLNDFNVEISTEFGEVRVDGKKHGEEYNHGQAGGKVMDIDADSGSIKVNFDQ